MEVSSPASFFGTAPIQLIYELGANRPGARVPRIMSVEKIGSLPRFNWDDAERIYPGAKAAFPMDPIGWDFRWSFPSMRSIQIDGIFAYEKGNSLKSPYLYFQGKWRQL